MVRKLHLFPLAYCVWAFAVPVYYALIQWDALIGGGMVIVILSLATYFAWAAVWAAYMFMSLRVRNTFVTRPAIGRRVIFHETMSCCETDERSD